MKHTNKPIRILLSVLALAILTVILGLASGTLPSLGEWFPTSPLTPPSPEAMQQGLQSSPLDTPVPLSATAIFVAAVEPTVPPPPGYPADQPWPPQITPASPQPTTPPRPFPVPAFRPTPSGRRPAQLQRVWFPYFPDPAGPPQLRAVLMDQQGQRWAQNEQAIDLGLRSGFPGLNLLELHPSPDRRLVVADIAFGESVQSVVIDPSVGVSRPIFGEPIRFLAWTPDSQSVIVQPPTFPLEVWVLNVASQVHQLIDFPVSDFGDSLVRAVAYSPDGSQIADAVAYPATVSNPIEEIEIGVRVGEQGARRSLLRLPGGSMVAEHSLRWSPDGRNLIFVADVIGSGRSTQLWMIDVADGVPRMLMQLAESVQYNHPALWSPDGRYIAVLKVEGVRDNKETANNAYLLDVASGAARQLTRFTDQHLTHLQWSPDGRWLAFTISMGDYGEIWITDPDGRHQYPIAGPTTSDAPFVWLP